MRLACRVGTHAADVPYLPVVRRCLNCSPRRPYNSSMFGFLSAIASRGEHRLRAFVLVLFVLGNLGLPLPRVAHSNAVKKSCCSAAGKQACCCSSKMLAGKCCCNHATVTATQSSEEAAAPELPSCCRKKLNVDAKPKLAIVPCPCSDDESGGLLICTQPRLAGETVRQPRFEMNGRLATELGVIWLDPIQLPNTPPPRSSIG